MQLPLAVLPFVAAVAALASKPFEDCFLEHFGTDSSFHFEEQLGISKTKSFSSLASRENSVPTVTVLAAEWQ